MCDSGHHKHRSNSLCGTLCFKWYVTHCVRIMQHFSAISTSSYFSFLMIVAGNTVTSSMPIYSEVSVTTDLHRRASTRGNSTFFTPSSHSNPTTVYTSQTFSGGMLSRPTPTPSTFSKPTPAPSNFSILIPTPSNSSIRIFFKPTPTPNLELIIFPVLI